MFAYTATLAKKAGWHVAVVDAWALGLTLEECLDGIAGHSPDTVFFVTNAPELPVVLELARRVKQRCAARVVSLGSVPTFIPERIIGPGLPVDVGIVGETDLTAVALLDAFDAGAPLEQVEGIVHWDEAKEALNRTEPRPLIDDLDSLPPLDYSLFDLRHYYMYSVPVAVWGGTRWGYVLTSRGCPFACSHCNFDHRKTFGKKYRMASAARVVDEMEGQVRDYGVNVISIEDDCFSLKRQHVLDVCDEIERRGLRLKWVIETRVDLFDAELLRRMKAAGCQGLTMGIESGSDRVLKTLKKGFTRKQAEDGIRLARQAGMAVRLLFMIGNPGETEEDVAQTLDLALRSGAVTVEFHLCTPFPGTSMLGEAENDGKYIEDFSPFDTIVYNMSAIPDERLWSLQRSLYFRYYFSLRFFMIFLRQRLLPLITNVRREVLLIFNTLLYLTSHSRRPGDRAVANASEETPPADKRPE